MSETAEKKARNFVHVPFDQMDCPVDECAYNRGKPQHGTIPGIKRHVLRVHGKDAYDKVTWPPLRAAEVPTQATPADDAAALHDLTVTELKEVAKAKGVKGYSHMKKPELEKVLVNV